MSVADPILYGDWRIYENDFRAHHDWRTVRWLYVHDDYDGPEDDRSGFAASIEACKAEIDEWEEEHAEPAPRAIPTTCLETIGGDPNTAIRLSFQIKVF